MNYRNIQITKNQKIVDRLWGRLYEPENNGHYWQQILILQGIFEQVSLVKYNLDIKKSAN